MKTRRSFPCEDDVAPRAPNLWQLRSRGEKFVQAFSVNLFTVHLFTSDTFGHTSRVEYRRNICSFIF